MFAITDKIQLAYIKEVTLGTTPSTPAMQKLRITGESLAYQISTKQSEEITGLGNVKDLIQTARNAGGGFNFEMSYGTFDDVLASVLGADWATDVLKNGQSILPLTLEKRMATGVSAGADTYDYLRYRGMVGNTLSLKIAANDIITGSVDFVGMGSTHDSAIITGETYTNATDTIPLNASDNVGTLTLGSFTSPQLSSVDLSINHNAAGAGAIGSQDFVDIRQGEFGVTGTIEAYFNDGTLYDAFANATLLGLSLNVGAVSGSKYTLSMPSIKFSDCQIQAGSKNNYLMAKMPFTAIYNATLGATMSITRAVA